MQIFIIKIFPNFSALFFSNFWPSKLCIRNQIYFKCWIRFHNTEKKKMMKDKPNTTEQGWKKPGLKQKKPAQWFFCCFFFLVFLGFLGFFWFFFYIFICPEERVFKGFFSFKNTFRCIQTFNYNHSY